MRRKRPPHRAPNHFDEVASPHCLPQPRDPAIFGFQLRRSEHEIATGEIGFQGQCCDAESLSRPWQQRVIFIRSTRFRRSRHVRFAPIASEPSHRSESTRCANSRPEQAQQTEQAYSITSSTRMSKIVGISRPSALAVRKLITRSNLVGSTNGSSTIFSPFRMRPT